MELVITRFTGVIAWRMEPWYRRHFTKLLCWQEALVLLAEIVELVKSFRGPDAASTARQLISAAESISSNIAEGYGKGFTPDNLRYLRIAIASGDEVESRLLSSIAAGRIRMVDADIPLRRVRRIRSQIVNLGTYVEQQIKKAS